APFRHASASRYAWHLEKSPPPHPVLARVHASPFPGAENLGRTRPLDTACDHGVALSASIIASATLSLSVYPTARRGAGSCIRSASRPREGCGRLVEEYASRLLLYPICLEERRT